MGFKINRLKDSEPMAKKFKLTEDTFLKTDGSGIAGKGDAQRMLLGRKGKEIFLTEAEKLGLVKVAKKELTDEEKEAKKKDAAEKKAAKKAEDKALKDAKENK